MSPVDERGLREGVVRTCKLLHDRGYLAANDGNVSVRLGTGDLLVTPTGVHKGFLKPEDLLRLDANGRKLEGTGEPTGELALHLMAMRSRPDIRAVVHAHPPTCIAMSLLEDVRLNGILPEVILSIGRLTIVPYARPVSDELAEALREPLAKNDAVILERHGTVAVGRTVEDAYSHTERLEHASVVLWKAYSVGRPRPLPRPEAMALEEAYERARLSSR